MGIPIYLHAQLNRVNWAPDFCLPSVANTRPDYMKTYGIEVVVFDFDNTLGFHHAPELHPSLTGTIERYRDVFGGNLAIISNTARPQRRAQLQEMFPDFYISQSNKKKPNPEPFVEVMDRFGFAPQNFLFIDDMLFSGVVGAKNVGWHTIKVDPLAPQTDPFGHRMQRYLDAFALRVASYK